MDKKSGLENPTTIMEMTEDTPTAQVEVTRSLEPPQPLEASSSSIIKESDSSESQPESTEVSTNPTVSEELLIDLRDELDTTAKLTDEAVSEEVAASTAECSAPPLESADPEPPVPVYLNSSDVFYIRAIVFQGRTRRIVMQSANGPCPLISLVNALSLMGRVQIPRGADVDSITRLQLTTLIGDLLLARSDEIQESQKADFEATLNEVLTMLPTLGNGLEVNLMFYDISKFEYTIPIALFDLLAIKLYHSWVVEEDYASIIGQKSYNEVTALAFDNDLIASFLEETRTQMTYTGLSKLIETLQEGAFAVLFRNNHFHTVYKQNNQLFLLCTDVGFMHQPKIVWEALDNIEGDSRWADAEFRIPVIGPPPDVQEEKRPPSANDISDYELAKKLDAELNFSAHSSAQQTPAETPRQEYLPRQEYIPQQVVPPKIVAPKQKKSDCSVM